MHLPNELLYLIAHGENNTVEFKESTTDITKDANLSHGHGILSLATFTPFPKNPYDSS